MSWKPVALGGLMIAVMGVSAFLLSRPQPVSPELLEIHQWMQDNVSMVHDSDPESGPWRAAMGKIKRAEELTNGKPDRTTQLLIDKLAYKRVQTRDLATPLGVWFVEHCLNTTDSLDDIQRIRYLSALCWGSWYQVTLKGPDGKFQENYLKTAESAARELHRLAEQMQYREAPFNPHGTWGLPDSVMSMTGIARAHMNQHRMKEALEFSRYAIDLCNHWPGQMDLKLNFLSDKDAPLIIETYLSILATIKTPETKKEAFDFIDALSTGPAAKMWQKRIQKDAPPEYWRKRFEHAWDN